MSADPDQATEAAAEARPSPERVGPAVADELSDAALDAVVGGLTTGAALARAAAFDGRTSH